jgi:hypothetical protein
VDSVTALVSAIKQKISICEPANFSKLIFKRDQKRCRGFISKKKSERGVRLLQRHPRILRYERSSWIIRS